MPKTNISPSNDCAKPNSSELVREVEVIVSQLRGPGGCPWDIKQTHHSLLQYLLEESQEVVAEIESGKTGDSLKEELCDLLLQVFLHAQIAAEENRFSFADILQRLKEKLIFRHPHVFGDNPRRISEKELDEQWKRLKAIEKQQQKHNG